MCAILIFMSFYVFEQNLNFFVNRQLRFLNRIYSRIWHFFKTKQPGKSCHLVLESHSTLKIGQLVSLDDKNKLQT